MKALLLLGSPREKSVSRMLGEALLARLAQRGFESAALRLTGLMEAQEGRARLSGEFLGADLVILASPVYVDAPPAPVMRALEFLAGEPSSRGSDGARPRRFTAVFSCGFPEAGHTDLCLDVCRLFARDAGLAWSGGLGVGGAGALDPSGLHKRAGMAAGLRRALDLSAASLSAGGNVPQEARELAARPLAPRWLYLLMAEAGWLVQAFKRGALFKLGDKPYGKP
jgi:hypothetical protein